MAYLRDYDNSRKKTSTESVLIGLSKEVSGGTQEELKLETSESETVPLRGTSLKREAVSKSV